MLAELLDSQTSKLSLKEALKNPRQHLELDFSQSGLRSLHDISAFSNVKELNLNRNHIETISSEISALSQLRTLYVQGNQLQSISSEIGALPNLETLSAGGNRIRAVEPELGAAPLVHLSLCYNEMDSLDFLRNGFSQLVSIDVAYNNLAAADLGRFVSILASLPSLKVVTLSGNPLSLWDSYRPFVVDALPNLVALDDVRITTDERDKAAGASKLPLPRNFDTTLSISVDCLSVFQSAALLPPKSPDLPCRESKVTYRVELQVCGRTFTSDELCEPTASACPTPPTTAPPPSSKGHRDRGQEAALPPPPPAPEPCAHPPDPAVSLHVQVTPSERHPFVFTVPLDAQLKDAFMLGVGVQVVRTEVIPQFIPYPNGLEPEADEFDDPKARAAAAKAKKAPAAAQSQSPAPQSLGKAPARGGKGMPPESRKHSTVEMGQNAGAPPGPPADVFTTVYAPFKARFPALLTHQRSCQAVVDVSGLEPTTTPPIPKQQPNSRPASAPLPTAIASDPSAAPQPTAAVPLPGPPLPAQKLAPGSRSSTPVGGTRKTATTAGAKGEKGQAAGKGGAKAGSKDGKTAAGASKTSSAGGASARGGDTTPNRSAAASPCPPATAEAAPPPDVDKLREQVLLEMGPPTPSVDVNKVSFLVRLTATRLSLPPTNSVPTSSSALLPPTR